MNSFTDHYYRTYAAKKWTFEHFFCFFTYFVIFALPFYFCFAEKSTFVKILDFWFDEQFSLMNVEYSYSGYYGLQVSYINGTTWTTQQLAVIPSSKMTQLSGLSLDISDSQQKSEFTFLLGSDLNTSKITSVNVILFYEVRVPALDRSVSTAYAINIDGDFQTAIHSSMMELRVSEPFNGISSNKAATINTPVYLDSYFQSPSTYEDLMNIHLQSDYGLETGGFTSVTTGTGNKSIIINLLKKTSLILPYYPSILQTFKLKFSTYFGMLILSYFIFRGLILLLVENQALQCHQKDEAPPTFSKKTQ